MSYEIITNAYKQQLQVELAHPESNTDIIKLEKAPKVAVYSPEGNLPWDDAVTMVLTYSEIPYDIIYDQEILSDVLIMGENKSANEAKYIHGKLGKGMWTFYGGHDPEDYQHRVGDPPTELELHPNSAGYRLILNNILFPAAKKKKQKT